MDEVVVRRTTTGAEAWVTHAALTAAGISSARVVGEHLAGLRWALPISETWVEVRVATVDVEAARAVLARLEGPTLVHPAWSCAGCGEENPPAFDTCWSCLRER